PAEALPDFIKEPFLEPEELCRDENLKAKDLAVIAAPFVRNQSGELSTAAAVGAAHELLRAAERYVNGLPEQKRGNEQIIEDFNGAFTNVTFAEIAESNRKGSGRLPLLPATGQKRKDRAECEQNERPLSLLAIRLAVKRHL